MSDKSKIEAIYQLSPLQEGMLFHTAADRGAGVYFEQTTYTLTGHVDAQRFRSAWQRVIDRHAILRTAFNKVGTMQVVFKKAAAPWAYVDLRALPEGRRAAELQNYLARDRHEGFDVTAAPLLRFALMRFADTTYKFVVSYHHTLLDGWSYIHVLKEVTAFYEALSRNVELRMPEPRPFRDYIQWVKRQDHTRTEAFWRARLSGLAEPTYLLDAGRGSAPVGKLGEAERIIDAAGLTELTRRYQLTLNTVVQGAWALLLARYTGRGDVAFGVTVSGRPAELSGVESMVGLFINTVPARVRVGGGEAVGEWLRGVQREQAEVYAHQYARLSDIQAWSEAGGGRALFDTLVVFENYPVGGAPQAVAGAGGGFTISGEESWERVNYPLALVVSGGAELRLRLLYDEGLIEPDRAEAILRHLETLLRGMAATPQASASSLSLCGEEERRAVLQLGRGMSRHDGPALRVEELVAARARRQPQAIAVADETGTCSYGELDERAGRIAAHLRKLGVRPDDRVGVLLPRGVDAVCAMLAVWKAGGACVPLDATYPEQRLTAMLRDSGAEWVISSRDVEVAGRLGECGHVWLEEAEAAAEEPHESAASEAAGGGVEALAYVIYTSGSTGTPKGVGVSHRSLYNLVRWHVAEYALTPQDRMTQMASLSFDASVWETWPALVAGARVDIVPEGVRGDVDELGRWLKRKGVTITFMPTPLAEDVLNRDVALPDTLRVLLTGGDRLRRWADARADYRLINHYGPTESTVLVSCGAVAAHGDGLPAIGRPVTNTQLYVLDDAGHLCPAGVPGELYIGGAGLARGYLNRPALTAERFLPDPLSGEPGARLYRTGDVVRWRADGQLEFIGRVDHQVKLRGHRVELGEVEAAISSHPGVRQCAAAVREVAGTPALVAYVAGAASAGELREHAAQRLPAYMMPQRFVALDSLPLTTNGKIDRRALLAIDALADNGMEAVAYAAPRTPTEEILCGIWAEVLGQERVGVEEDFFALGGHSLLATQVVARARAAFGVEVALRAVFESPTVEALAREVERARAADSGASAPALIRAERGGRLPLSFAQQRLWFLHQLEPRSAAYNVPFAVRLSGDLDAGALRSALCEVVRRHEVLRTSFPSVAGEPVQLIHAPRPVAVPVLDLSALPAGWRERVAREIAAAEAARPFDLAAGPLLRVRLLRLSEREHALVVVLHHIVSDGWSAGVLVREFTRLYEAIRRGRPSPLEELPVQYADYAVWQREWLQGEALDEQLAYWRESLSGLERLELPTDAPRAAGGGLGRAGVVRFELSEGLTSELRALSRREGVTLFMLLTAAFQLLLSRYSAQDDIAVGTDIANRQRVEVEPLVGFFINQLVLRARAGGGETVRGFLGRVRETVLGAYAHQEVPFERLVEELAPERGAGSPFFSAKLVLQNTPQTQVAVGGLSVSPFGELPSKAKLDLHLTVSERTEAQGLECVLTYPQTLYGRERMQRIAAHYARVLEFFTQVEAKTHLAELELTSEAERSALIKLGCGEATAVGGTVIEWVEEQASLEPRRRAVVGAGRHYKYAELSERSNQLARYLLRLGVGPETRVAIYLGRTPEFVLAVLGIWKAGGAYVPLDPEQPAERLAAMLEDAGAAVVVTDAGWRRQMPAHWAVEVALDEEADAIGAESREALELTPSLRSLAYVLYTSGSTGRPKGVGIEHAQLANYVQGVTRRLGLGRGRSYGLVSTLAADLGHTVLYPALATGGTLHIIPSEMALDGAQMGRYVREEEIDCIKLTPSHMRAWAASGELALPRRKLVLGGEALQREWIERLRESGTGCEIWNHYGPTETTVGVTAGRAEDYSGMKPALGRPLANTQLYVLDGEGRLCPAGVPGELYIGGAGLARGYLNRPALTAEHFLPDPFAGAAGARLYRTGDVVRWRADGQLEFIGRADTQVKLRGHRVELGEVEAAISSHPGVRQCAAAVREVAGAPALVAYVAGEVKEGELRERLSRRLPAYMIPQRFVALDSLPLTTNGKIDRRALLAIDALADNGMEAVAYAAPRTPTEEILCGIWAEVLGLERVGVDEDFFALGGHSLLATQVVARARAAFGVEVALRAVFESPTVEALAREVERARAADSGASAPALIRAERGGRLPLSFAQQRLWFLHQLEPHNPAYNSPRIVRLEGALDYGALAEALNEVVRRHEVLRTSFPSVAGEPSQYIVEAQPLRVPVVDVEGLRKELREPAARALAAAEAARPFDLAAGPLLRVVLVRVGAREHLLLLVLHHIVSDGWSVGVLMREFTRLYEAFRQGRPSPLAELPVQYADYAIWQREWLKGDVLGSQLDYWRTQLDGLEPVELPTDRPRSAAADGGRAGVVRFELSEGLTSELRALSRREGVTLFMLLTAAFQLLLSRYSAQDDIAVGTDIANRQRVEVEPLVGFFVNTLVLRARLSGHETVRELLSQVRETVLGAYEHQELPFDRLVEELVSERDLSRSQLFQHAISLQSKRGEKPWQIGDLRLSSLTLDVATTKRDLDILLFEQDSVEGFAHYDAGLFSAATIERLIRSFQSILEQFARNADAALVDITTERGGELYATQLATSVELLEV